MLLQRFLLLLLLTTWARPQVQAQPTEQSSITLNVVAEDFRWKVTPPTFSDSLAVVEYLAEWLTEQRGKAYWEASVDSLYFTPTPTPTPAPTPTPTPTPNPTPTPTPTPTPAPNLTAVLHRGEAYRWAELRAPDNVEAQRWLRRSGFRPGRFTDRPLRPEDWTSIRDSSLLRAASAGYPFASMAITDVAWTGDRALSGTITVNPGPLIRVGEIRAPETARVRPVFLQRYLGLQVGEPYHERRVRRMGNSLRQLPYLTVRGSPRISFQDSLMFVDLPLEKRAASRFDFVIGVLPNSAQNDGKLLLTGDLNGELQNGFGQGERIAVRFEQLRPQTQELEVGLEYPFLFGLPFGFEGALDLYRRDTTFLNLNYRVAGTYLREGNDRLSVFWENRRTIIPSGNDRAEPAVSSTDTLGVIRSFFGLQARRGRTDRRFSPRRGYRIDLSAAAGTRRLADPSPRDSLNDRGGQAQLAAALDFYVTPLGGTVLYFGFRGAGVFSGSAILPNEQYRIGGANLLRGFDEQSVFARDYAVLTTEFRLLLGGNAFLYTFLDAARVNPRNRAEPAKAIDYPLGFGAGVNFDTRAGVFGLSLAVGRSNGIPLSETISSPKLHFGYVSLF